MSQQTNVKNTNRNNEIEFFRFLFICSIAIMHFSNSYFKSTPYFSGAYIGTEFFFLVSGYMIMKSAHTKNISSYTFTLFRAKKLYPHYITAFLFLFISSMIVNGNGLIQWLKGFLGYIFELLFLHASGLKSFGLLNYPTWYLSSLLIAGFFVYALIRFNEKLYLTIIAPLAVLATYSFFSANVGHLDVWGGSQFLGLSDALTRGFAAMSLGALSYTLSNYLSNKDISLAKPVRISLSFIEFFLFVGVIGGAMFSANTQYDFYYVLMLFAGITLAFSNLTYTSQLFSSQIFAFLGKISYPMYVYQLFIICMFCIFCPKLPYSIGIITFLLVTVIFSAIMDFLILQLTRKFSAIK